MESVYPTEGLEVMLDRVLAADDFVIRLFTNNYVPVPATTLADLTQAAWAGYAAVTYDATDLAFNAVVGDRYLMLFDPAVFSNTSGAPVDAWGYYVTDTANTKVLQATRFDSMRTIPDGGTTSVILAMSDFSENT